MIKVLVKCKYKPDRINCICPTCKSVLSITEDEIKTYLTNTGVYIGVRCPICNNIIT